MASKALLDKLGLTREERKKFEKTLRQAKLDVHVLVAGKTGTGKSKLVNALTGAIVAREGHSTDPESGSVQQYQARTEGGYTVNVWDSPGLFDGSGRNRDYVESMRRECGDKIDILLYCISMSDKRADLDEMTSGMRLLTETLGQDVWSHAMIILTFANVVAERIAKECSDAETVESKFQAKVEQWKKKVHSALEGAGVQHEMIAQVSIEPAGHYLIPHLPDRIHWLGYLWLLFLFHIKDEAKLAILITNENRIWSSEYLQPSELAGLIEGAEDTSQIPLVINREHAIKIGIIGGVGGAATLVGGVTGAAVGGVLLGTLTAGVGAGVGVAAGGAVGVGVGLLCSHAVTKMLERRKTKKESRESS